MKKIVAFINAVPNLIFFELVKETSQKYKYLSHPEAGWTNFIKKEYAIYVGEETEDLKNLQVEYTKTIEEIKKQKQIQNSIIEQINKLSTNENILYKGEPE